MKLFLGTLWQLLIIISKIFHVQRMIICARTEKDVAAELAIIAPEES